MILFKKTNLHFSFLKKWSFLWHIWFLVCPVMDVEWLGSELAALCHPQSGVFAFAPFADQETAELGPRAAPLLSLSLSWLFLASYLCSALHPDIDAAKDVLEE